MRSVWPGIDVSPVPDIAALQMRVSKEGNAGLHITEDVARVIGRHKVLVLIERRAVNQVEIIHRHRTGGQVAQIIKVHRSELRHRPDACDACHWVEPFEILKSGAGAVVIAANDGVEVGARPVNDRVRIGAVADQVAAADDAVVPIAGIRENGFEGFPIAVKIADDEVAHASGFSQTQ